MATMTPAQITAELQRKRNLGIVPTNPANNAQYNSMTKQTASTTPKSTATGSTTTLQPVKSTSVPNPSLAPFGGYDAYAKSQNERWQAANASGDTDMMSRLQADAKRVGYTLNPYNAPSVPTPTQTNPTASSNVSDYSAYKSRMDESLARLESLMQGSASYDPATDPKYQAMRTLSQQRAGEASQAAMEALNDRGILNSTITGSQLAQIQQDAEQEALAYIPQYEAMAREDYRNRVADALNMFNTIRDLEDTQYNRDYTAGRDAVADDQWQQSFDRGVLESDRNYDRSVYESDRDFDRGVYEYEQEYAYREARDAIADKQYQQQFDEDVRRYGLEYALQQAELKHKISTDNAQLAISRMNANTSAASAANSASNANFSRLMDIWNMTGVAPSGLEGYGIQAGQTLPTKESTYDYKTDPDFADDVAAVNSDPTGSLTQIQQNAQAFINKYGYDGYQELLKAANQ